MITLNPVSDQFRKLLATQVPEDCFRPLSPSHLEDPRGNYVGMKGIVLAPRTVDEVSTIVRLCAEHLVPIVPIGGGTGLVAGHIMTNGPAPVILSLDRMKAIRELLPQEDVIVVEAGATLFSVQEAAKEAGLLFPLSLAAEGTCQIGGNLATNARGVNVLRYGNMRDLCLGLEVVLPDGQIWHGLSRLRKDNSGFDLRNLLIGSEGALGIITAATLRLHPRPSGYATALMTIGGSSAALKLLKYAQKLAGSAISAFELIQGVGLDFLSETMPDLRLPFDKNPEWAVLIDLGLHKGQNGDDILLELFEFGLEAGLVNDGLIAQSEGQRTDFWNVREHIPEANRLIGAVANHDISLPLGKIPEFIELASARIQEIAPLRVNCFGHLGDGNLHFNIFPPRAETPDAYVSIKPSVDLLVCDLVKDLNGSFSAEHGIGRAKVEMLQKYGDPAKLFAIDAIKQALDPSGIMNPGADLPNTQ
ncbi:FAD-binding oxidoreductase [Tropicibacter sp. Alg240-R139]|uniref:FAD-binding oxidoreductase n=1 Tax=Tropicibacter sp. Alg240-R139 TaxID=2305991 RepID=UPI0013DEC639|nr:FAD-binding oxidoreductase [Tropicibacter sp. Alg240-R139]